MPTLRSPRRSGASGFTLIELLVVIIILAILAAVVIPNIINRTGDARKAKALADISTIDTQLDVYKLDTGAYPTTDETLEVLVSNKANSPRWGGPYLKSGLPVDPWGQAYQYKNPGEHGNVPYDVFSPGEDGQPGTADDIGNWDLTNSKK